MIYYTLFSKYQIPPQISITRLSLRSEKGKEKIKIICENRKKAKSSPQNHNNRPKTSFVQTFTAFGGFIVGITGSLLALMLENGELAIEVLGSVDIMGGYG